MAEANSGPSCKNLLDRGRFFLEESEFKTASLYFNRVLDMDSGISDAYWGLLLTEYQCKSSEELYSRLSVPIGNNKNFNYALKYADDKKLEEYERIEKAVLLSCHRKALKYFFEGNDFLKDKWISHYSSATTSDLFKREHEYILKTNINSKEYTLPGFLLNLYAQYDSDADLGEKCIAESLKEMVKNEYTLIMNNILNKILKDPAKASEQDIIIWSCPLDVNLEGYENAGNIGLDGNPSSPAARFVFLAEKIFNTKKITIEKCAKVDFCYKMALNLEDNEDFREKRARFYETVVMRDDAGLSEIDYIISLATDTAKYHWKYVLTYTKGLTLKLTLYEKDSDYEEFMKKGKYTYSKSDVDEILDKHKKDEESLNAEYNNLFKAISPYALNAVNLSSGEENDMFYRDWEKFKSRLQSEYEENLTYISERVRNIKEKVSSDDKSGKKIVNIKATVLSAVTLIILAFSFPIYLFIDYSLDSPIELLENKLIYVYLTVFAVSLVVSLVQIVSTTLISKYKPTKYKMPLIYRIFIYAARVIACLILPATVAALVHSYSVYPQNIGTLTISTVEDVFLISNIPQASFSLETDLDLEGVEIEGIDEFSGIFYGNGHSISNMKLPENGFIKTNNGTVCDLNVISATTDGEFVFIYNNKGTISNIVVSDVSLENKMAFGGLVETNKGKVISCKVTNISGIYSSFTGMCGYNSGQIKASIVDEIDVEVVNANGFASGNSGTIIGCTFSGDINGTGIVNGFVSSMNDSDSRIERCSASGNIKGGQNVSGFIGSLGNGIVKDSYSVINVAQECCEYNDCIGGLINNFSTEDSGNAQVLNCYYGGKITVLPGENSYQYELVGGLFGSALYVSSNESYSILIDSCFAVAKYDFSSVSKGYGVTAYKSRVTLNNTYGTSENDTGYADIDGELVIKKKSKILDSDFIIETLGWDAEIWNIKDNKLPTLKPYIFEDESVIEVETTVDVEV